MQLTERYGLAAVAIDPKSNAATLIAPAERAGLPVKTPDANDVAVSLGTFADLMTAGKLRHHNQAQLTTAVRFAEARRLAGAAALQRYGTAVDAAPAIAAELSVWGLGDLERPGPAFFATWR
jgi:hypothetical protein